MQLHRLVDDGVACLAGGVLGHRDLEHRVTGGLPLRHRVARAGPGDPGLPGHLGDLVPDDLTTGQGSSEGVALLDPLDRQVQAALRRRVRLHRQGEPLGLELLHDLHEPGAGLPDQVRDRDPCVQQAQLSGVRAVPAHLLQAAVDGETRCPAVDDEQRDPRVARPARAHGGRHEVRPHPAGDVGLAAVDDVVVTVADRGRAQGGDVRSAAGLGDGERSDQASCEGRPDVAVDELGGAVPRDVRQRDAVREQRRDDPARAAAEQDLLGDDRRVHRVASPSAELLGERDAEQAGVGEHGVQRAGQLAVALPLRHVGRHLPGHQVTGERSQGEPLRGRPRVGRHGHERACCGGLPGPGGPAKH